MKLRSAVTTMAFAVIFSFVFIFSSLIFIKIFVQPDQLFIIQGLSAFMGAFFAFLFLRLADFLERIYKRQVKHYNSLVILETQLNELGGIIHDNIYLIPFFRDAITSGNIYFSKLRQLPIDRSHYESLHDIDFINDLFTFNYQLRKINDDIDSLADGYVDIKNAYIQHHIEKQDYLINAQISADLLTALEAFLGDMEERTVQLMAKARLMARKDMPLGTKIARWFIHTSGSKLKKKEVDKEAKKLLKEIEETKTQSQKEIEEVIKKYRSKQPK